MCTAWPPGYLRVYELGVPVAVDGDDHRQVGDEYGDREQRDERALRDAGHGDAERQPVGGEPRVPAAAVVQERSREHRRPAGPHPILTSWLSVAAKTERKSTVNDLFEIF